VSSIFDVQIAIVADYFQVYRRYSQIPFWDIYEKARKNFSFPSMVFAGAPTGLLSNYLEAKVARLWLGDVDRKVARKLYVQLCHFGGVSADRLQRARSLVIHQGALGVICCNATLGHIVL
jgi:hypothetical protein